MSGSYMPQGSGSWKCEWCGLWFDGGDPQRYVYGREEQATSLPYGSGPYCLVCIGKLYVEDKGTTDKVQGI